MQQFTYHLLILQIIQNVIKDGIGFLAELLQNVKNSDVAGGTERSFDPGQRHLERVCTF